MAVIANRNDKQR